MIKTLAFTIFLAACTTTAPDGMTGDDDSGGGGGGGSGSGSGSGSGGTSDHITLSGSAVEQGQSGSTALANATVAAYPAGGSSPMVMATSDAQGKYTLTIGQGTFDGYIKVTKSGYADTYVYPPSPWKQDAALDVAALSTMTYSLLDTFAGGDSSKGLIIAVVADASGAPVSGAKISSTPASGSYKYSDGTGTPSGNSSTSADGTAFFMSAPLGDVSITATKSGATFHAHAVTSRQGALIVTSITE